MKKIFKRISLVLMLGAMGLTTTSCSEDIINTIVQIIGGMFNQGETYNYNGQSTAVAMVFVGNVEKQNNTDETQFNNTSVSLVAKQGQSGNTADITLPDFTWNSIQVKGLKLYGLNLTTTNNVSTLSIGQETTIDGTFTYGGKTYTACFAEIKGAEITQSQMALAVVAQFDDGNDNTMQIAFSFAGNIVSQ